MPFITNDDSSLNCISHKFDKMTNLQVSDLENCPKGESLSEPDYI